MKLVRLIYGPGGDDTDMEMDEAGTDELLKAFEQGQAWQYFTTTSGGAAKSHTLLPWAVREVVVTDIPGK